MIFLFEHEPKEVSGVLLERALPMGCWWSHQTHSLGFQERITLQIERWLLLKIKNMG